MVNGRSPMVSTTHASAPHLDLRLNAVHLCADRADYVPPVPLENAILQARVCVSVSVSVSVSVCVCVCVRAHLHANMHACKYACVQARGARAHAGGCTAAALTAMGRHRAVPAVRRDPPTARSSGRAPCAAGAPCRSTMS